MIDYAILKTEITSDPRGYGYATPWVAGTDWQVAELLNRVRDTIAVDKDLVSTPEIFEAIVPGEWAVASAQEKQRIQLILSMGSVDLRGPNTRASFQAAFGSGTQSRANLVALLTRKGSRAEELFGSGVSVSWDDVAKARRV
uniref:Uncharacterized protein n=1 Tax=viral metagenome TaxID=1070528 RepID=A0A6M3IJS8_9ZZZZ